MSAKKKLPKPTVKSLQSELRRVKAANRRTEKGLREEAEAERRALERSKGEVAGLLNQRASAQTLIDDQGVALRSLTATLSQVEANVCMLIRLVCEAEGPDDSYDPGELEGRSLPINTDLLVRKVEALLEELKGTKRKLAKANEGLGQEEAVSDKLGEILLEGIRRR